MNHTATRTAIATVLLLAMIVLAASPVVANNHVPFSGSGNVFEILGEMWATIGIGEVYSRGGFGAQFVDALITFLIVFMTVYNVATSGKRTFPKPVAIGLALMIWLPLVVWLYSSGTLLLSSVWMVGFSYLLLVAVGYMWFDKLLEGIGWPKSKGFRRFIAILASFVLASLVLHDFLYYANANTLAEESFRNAILGVTEAAQEIALILVFGAAALGLLSLGGVGAYKGVKKWRGPRGGSEEHLREGLDDAEAGERTAAALGESAAADEAARTRTAPVITAAGDDLTRDIETEETEATDDLSRAKRFRDGFVEAGRRIKEMIRIMRGGESR